MLSNAPTRKTFFIMGLVFWATSMVYYGLAYNVAALPGTLYLNNFLNAILEGFAYICITASTYFIGRRPLTGGTLLFGATACLASGLLFLFSDTENVFEEVGRWLSFIGRFFVAGTFG